nr:TonB-dependent siderophore receptor [Bradyrhizobium sp. dw_411]
MSVAVSRQAIGQEQPQQQPGLPPVIVQAPTQRPTATAPESPSGQGAKPRRPRRAARRSAPANGAAAREAAAAAAQQAAAAEAYRTREGSEAQGYKPSTISNFGPFGRVPILDTPYSVNVISADMLENIQALSPEDAFRISPVTQVQTPYTKTLDTFVNLRGFTVTSQAIDGLRTGTFGSQSIPVEDKERIEIITGLTGFLYGGTDVGGVVNYVYKTPTPIPYYSVTLGDYGNTSGYVHLDAGGPLDKNGTFAYRLNIVGQDGTLPVDPQKLKRGLITGVLDWNIAPDTKLEIVGSHQDQTLTQGMAWFTQTLPSGASLFNYKTVPDPAKLWAQPWATYNVISDRVEGKFNSKLNDVFTLRTAYSYKQDKSSPQTSIQNFWDDNKGTYDQFIFGNAATRSVAHSEYGFLDADFGTGFIQHKVTIGVYANQATYFVGADSGDTTSTDTFYNISQGPVYTPPANIVPLTSYFGQEEKLSTSFQTNYVLGDSIKFNDQWSALLGVNYANISNQNFNNAAPPFALTSAVDQSRVSPTFSLIYKPVSWISTYATYSESLLPGTFVPDLPAIYTNAGQILPSYVGTEYEFGTKANVGGVLWTAAWFNIDKANQFAQPNPDRTFTYVSDGREVHQGLELTATGNITTGFRILGGVTLMDATVVKTANPATDNKRPVNVADQMAKATLEYDLPFLRGLTLTGGAYYFGKQAADAINSVWIDPFVTEDIGLRYRTTLPSGQEAIYRLSVKNLTNHAYWMNNLFVGAPLTVAFSGQIKF